MVARAAALMILGVAAPAAQALTDDDRKAAATATATSNAACTALPKFYWEIGDRNGRIGWGTRGLLPPAQDEQMAVYSAGKWLYGAYVFERRDGQLSEADVDALTMHSGYANSKQCGTQATVGECFESGDLGAEGDPPTVGAHNAQVPASIGKFHYASGHFQKHAVDLGLASKTKAQLVDELQAYLSDATPPVDFVFSYNQPQLAGGAKTSAKDYAIFLRKILNGSLFVGGLGASAVCTYTRTTAGRTQCNADTDPSNDSVYSPVSAALLGTNEDWEYSFGHWVERDPADPAGVGSTAYSSPGAAGFYPWIDRDGTYYGILARLATPDVAAYPSVKCGRAIRKAWLRGVAQ